jgi:hypothetical protein
MEVFRRPRAAQVLERFERGCDVIEAGQREPAVQDSEGRGLGRLGEESCDVGFGVRGGQRQNRRPSGRRSSEGRNEAKDDAELEGLEIGAASVSRG